MSKTRLTQTMRRDIMDKFISYIKEQNPKFVKISEDFDNLINCLIKHIEKTLYQDFNVSDDVYNFLKKYNIFEEAYFGYLYNASLPWKVSLNQDFYIKFLPNTMYRAPKDFIKFGKTLGLKRDIITNSLNINSHYSYIIKEYITQETSKFYEERVTPIIDEWEKLEQHFHKIVYGVKTFEELLNIINFETLTEYYNDIQKSKGTSLLNCNKNDIDFVKSYLQDLKK